MFRGMIIAKVLKEFRGPLKARPEEWQEPGKIQNKQKSECRDVFNPDLCKLLYIPASFCHFTKKHSLFESQLKIQWGKIISPHSPTSAREIVYQFLDAIPTHTGTECSNHCGQRLRGTVMWSLPILQEFGLKKHGLENQNVLSSNIL